MPHEITEPIIRKKNPNFKLKSRAAPVDPTTEHIVSEEKKSYQSRVNNTKSALSFSDELEPNESQFSLGAFKKLSISENPSKVQTKLEDILSAKSEISLQQFQDKGNGCVAARAFQIGETILEDRCDLFVVNDSDIKSYCSNCLSRLVEASTSVKLKRCSACKFVYYCSRKCQELDWALHKAECVALQKNDQIRSQQTIRKFFRALIILSLQKEKADLYGKSTEDQIDYNFIFDSMKSHISNVSEEKKYMLAQAAIMFTKNFKSHIGASEMLEIFCKIMVNGFSILGECFSQTLS
ncbi:hypothetical protein BB561_000206 [Smittium simulii]|uniref:MYND-type domain-containing protein n=1 Tax=Smittium simulii TaxID=133385 RepID=A0A2T9Z018_9FUNG|nr:hypothetical protein BB561_000206 [Smittium simulii]